MPKSPQRGNIISFKILNYSKYGEIDGAVCAVLFKTLKRREVVASAMLYDDERAGFDERGLKD